MAATLTLISATPYALKYKYAYDGIGAQGIVRTQAQILADFAGVKGPSPLKALLAAATANAVWQALDEGPNLSIYTNVTQTAAASQAVQADLEVVVPDGNVLSASTAAGVSHQAVIELRYHHTIER